MGRIDDIRKRLEAATPGPWDMEREELSVHFSDEEQDAAMPDRLGPVYVSEFLSDSEDRIEADASFITNAPTDIGYLLRLVGELECTARLALRGGVMSNDVDGVLAGARQRAEAEPNSTGESDG
jgi:hypothetical protein